MVFKFFQKEIGSGISINEELAEELNKPVIKKFKRGKVRDLKTIWAEDLAEMGSLPSNNKNVKYYVL